MSVELDIVINTAQVIKKFENVKRSIPKVTSRAMQLASEKARDEARASAKKRLDKPRPATLKAIRNSWPNRGRVISGTYNASVFVMPFLVDELRPLVFKERETSVPQSGKGVISPTQDFRTNKFGNIPGLRRTALSRRRRSSKFLDVPLNNRNRKTLHLPPGLYQIKGGRRSRKLVMIVSYRKSRAVRRVWREYPKIVRNSFDKNYPILFRQGLFREIQKQL